MDSDKTEEETRDLAQQLEYETTILSHAVSERGSELTEEESDMVIRSQIRQIGNIIDTMEDAVGEGDMMGPTEANIHENLNMDEETEL